MGTFGTRICCGVWLVLAGCGSDADSTDPGVDRAAMDLSVDPCADFYRFACGGWQRAHPLSDTAASESRFYEADARMVPRLSAILQAELKGQRSEDDPYGDQTALYFSSCVQAGPSQREAVLAELKRVYATTSLSELMGVVARFRRRSSIAFMLFAVSPDPQDSGRYVIWLDPRGWEMPDRSDYLDDARQPRRRAYLNHIRNLASFFSSVTIDADAVLRVETALAGAALERTETIDPRSLNNRMALDEVEALAPGVPFRELLAAQGLDATGPIVVTQPGYVKSLATLFANTPLQDLKHYLAWQFLQDETPYLDDAIQEQNFWFWGPEFSGRTEPPSATSRCYRATTSEFGSALARPYVARHVSERDIEQARVEIEDLRAAMRARFERNDWLDEPTRQAALEKLEQTLALVGYPKPWPELPAFAFDPFDYLGNHWKIAEHGAREAANSLGRPRERGKLLASPLMVNAFYLPDDNSIQLPAGILQAPFFRPDSTSANRLATLGSVSGHELTHGFDASGRFYDAYGNLRDFWSEASSAAFDERAACLVDQYSQYEVLPGVNVNGALTVTENIADLSGVQVAYDAFATRSAETPTWAGFDAKQQFFLSYAQLYCENIRPEALQQRVATDRHAPSATRVNAVVSNLPEFASAFVCSADAAMVNPKPCAVW